MAEALRAVGFPEGCRSSWSSQEQSGLRRKGSLEDGQGDGRFRPGGPCRLYIKRRLAGPVRETVPGREEGRLPSAGTGLESWRGH